MKLKILIADDEERWRLLVRDFLENENFEVLEAANGRQAVDLLRADSEISLVILDIMMPVMDGIAACKEIRTFSKVPVLMVTACEDEATEIEGFHCGADEYVSKPIRMNAFMARVASLLKRMIKQSDIMEIAGMMLNLSAREVFIGGEQVLLTPKEYDLLLFLAENRNIAKSRQEILHVVWNIDYYGDARTVDTHIKNLRMKLGSAGNAIRTVRSMGYMLESRQ